MCNNFKVKLSVALLFCILFISCSHAAFEDLSVGARAMGMGGAFVGVSDDASGLFYNPAGITQLKRPEVTGTLSWLFPGSADSVYGYFGFVYPVMNIGHIGFSLLGRGINANGRYGDTTLGVSYARSIDSHISLGATVKLCAQGDTYPALPLFFRNRFPPGMSFDLGLMYKIPKNENLSFGLGIMDIGIGIWSLRLGTGYKFAELFKIFQNSIASADFVIRGDGEFKLNLGAEGWFKPNPKLQEILKDNLLGVRTGMKFGTAGDFSLALGVGIKSNNIEKTDWKLDLAIVPIYHTSSGFSGGNYCISYSMLFGDANKWEKEEQRFAKLLEEKRLLEEKIKKLEEDQRKALEELKKLEGLTVREEGEKIIIVATETAIHFASGSAEIVKECYDTLNKIAKALKAYPESIISVEGHTDNVPIGPKLKSIYPSNKELSQARAESVAQYFATQDISSGRLLKKGYGESKPVASNATEEGKTKNRRVEIIIQK